MQISRKADYALRAITFLVNQPDNKRSSISEIAESEGIPRDFLAKILKELCRAGFLKSFQGVTGGYQLAKDKSQISFLNVIEAMQGEVKVNMCVDDNGGCQCNHRISCTMLPFWKKIQKNVVRDLGDVTFDDPKFIRK
ncbi:MAG: Rrf2 family transcriptional regulator [candidate division Zixibacteria bacterium]|nr:Rrf2 family transcriptional regulator [candidate division Zixibacteria bacterium]NIR63185.1 Rrf2 family transcriptional regulator [candidate division Zixibacteria bacterium]NIS16969.1 Rrf2 family transcriptional regulator [candidate division Zixibacteria bacterium]NIS45163.1 Rrf2 family transcriptional regulator [candidate division Zixibacteria bacterium]NIT53347.1 Rrf2 family transcriptional regulator [candidate division Zixibacteria bacterium]